MARDLGAEYMELVARAYHPDRSGDIQLLAAPFNSANYPQESRSLVPQDPRTSHASVWMYLERVPLVVYGACDLAVGLRGPRLARRRRPDGRRADRLRRLPRSRPRGSSAAGHLAPGRGARGGRHLRDRRRRVERPPGVPRRLAEPPAADARRRELPQRAARLVPGRHGLGPRHDRDRRVPAHPRHHRAQPPRRPAGAQGLRGARPREPGRHPRPDPRGPVERGDGRPGMGRRARLPGVAPRDDRARRAVAQRRRPAGRGLLGRGERSAGLAEPERRALPAARRDTVARRVLGLSRRLRPEPRSQRRLRPREAEEHALLQHAGDPLPGRPRRGDPRRTSRSVRPRPPVCCS